MPARTPTDPDTLSLRFVFVPDGAPIPEVVNDFRDPIVLRAWFIPDAPPPLEDAMPISAPIAPATVLQEGDNSVGHVVPPSETARASITDRIPGSYNVAQNGALSVVPDGPAGLSPEQRVALIAAARNWADARAPYLDGGQTISGADCSGSLFAIYSAAGINIGYLSSGDFPNSPFFQKLPDDAALEVGDVAWWPGHLAIYAGNLVGQGNDIWTAFFCTCPLPCARQRV